MKHILAGGDQGFMEGETATGRFFGLTRGKAYSHEGREAVNADGILVAEGGEWTILAVADGCSEGFSYQASNLALEGLANHTWEHSPSRYVTNHMLSIIGDIRTSFIGNLAPGLATTLTVVLVNEHGNARAYNLGDGSAVRIRRSKRTTVTPLTRIGEFKHNKPFRLHSEDYRIGRLINAVAGEAFNDETLDGLEHYSANFKVEPGDRILLTTDGFPKQRHDLTALVKGQSPRESLYELVSTSDAPSLTRMFQGVVPHRPGLHDDIGLLVYQHGK